MKQTNKQNIHDDLNLIIATGNSRRSKNWAPKSVTWEWLKERLKTPTRTQETVSAYTTMPKADRDNIKDVGGFVGGGLKHNRRKTENVTNRTLVTLDLDHIDVTGTEVIQRLSQDLDCESVIYSTHSHREASPRLRLVIPLSRPVYNDEYQPVSRYIANRIGIDMVDVTSYEAARLMYWPSVSLDGEYLYEVLPGPLLDVEAVLASYDDWRDPTQWPVSSREKTKIDRLRKKQENPLEKKGIVGDFCHAYTVPEAIDAFLSEIYLPGTIPGRYTYAEGSATNGLVLYEDGLFAYSHHGTDPANETLCNAFDLVRLHLYSGLDDDAKPGTPMTRLPSFLKMSDVAREDDNVKRVHVARSVANAEVEFDYAPSDEAKDNAHNWAFALSLDRKGQVENTIDNALIILKNDPHLKNKLKYDEFANRALITGAVPWDRKKTDERDWTDTDESGLRHYMEKVHQITVFSKIEDAKNLTFDRNKYHPVRDYLNGLHWDGVNRVETAFIDYLGAVDEPYVREVAKMHFAATVARVMRPGIKYDTMVTLSGPQGIGKSTFLSILAGDWFSDSLDTMKGKEAAELIQGRWIIELGELNATRKSDRDTVKSFLSRQEDIYRVAYARNTSRFPRQCTFWGTTNEKSFLRDPTGDRRTLPVDCGIVDVKKNVFDDLAKERDQLWAEAVMRYTCGQPLYLQGEHLKTAHEKQMAHKDDVPLEGLIQSYLDTYYPENWEEMSLFDRRSVINGNDDTFTVNGEATYLKDRVCVLEIWCELLGNEVGNLKPINSREINDVLKGLPDWAPIKTPRNFGPLYGNQRGYERTTKY